MDISRRTVATGGEYDPIFSFYLSAEGREKNTGNVIISVEFHHTMRRQMMKVNK